MTLVKPTGLGTIVHLDLNCIALKAFAQAAGALRVGDTVPIDLPTGRILVFEAGTGRRLPHQ